MLNERPSHSSLSPLRIDALSRAIHLALVICGVAALVSGQFAGDYKAILHPGYTLHRWIGAAMAAWLGARVFWGIVGPRLMRFSAWWSTTRVRLKLIGQDIVVLMRFKLPARAIHEGLAGLVQAIGLIAFAWMAITGLLLFAWLEPGARATGWMRVMKELHEGGQAAVYGFLGLHAGAVVAHAFAGDDAWRHMFFLKSRHAPRP